MFNGYSVFQLAKLRQEDIERKVRDSWRHYVDPLEKALEEANLKIQASAMSCCQCSCA